MHNARGTMRLMIFTLFFFCIAMSAKLRGGVPNQYWCPTHLQNALIRSELSSLKL